MIPFHDVPRSVLINARCAESIESRDRVSGSLNPIVILGDRIALAVTCESDAHSEPSIWGNRLMNSSLSPHGFRSRST